MKKNKSKEDIKCQICGVKDAKREKAFRGGNQYGDIWDDTIEICKKCECEEVT